MMVKLGILSIFVCAALVAAKKHSKTTPEEEKEYFTEAWNNTFSARQLAKQPKWYLAKDQPADGTFQTRKYDKHWIARSWKKCRTGEEALRDGYLDLYLYFNGLSFQRTSYPLTYPVMVAVNSRQAATAAKPSKKSKEPPTDMTTPEPCVTKYVTQFYIPISEDDWAPKSTSSNVKAFKRGGEYYVREYQGNNTSTEHCEEQATQLAADLSNNSKIPLDNFIICAHYASPTGSGDPKLEVWMRKK